MNYCKRKLEAYSFKYLLVRFEERERERVHGCKDQGKYLI
jgi:hypothetical protein